MLNDFFSWNKAAYLPADAQTPLRALDRERFFELFKHAGLPDTAMNAEMADGYLVCCAVGPAPIKVHEWMEAIFGQANLPICADAQQQEELLQLLLRRHDEINNALRKGKASIRLETMLLPLADARDAQDCITPYQLDADGNRLGVWNYKEWARGFTKAMAQEPAWLDLLEDDTFSALTSPIFLYELGYNPENLSLQVDDNQQLQAFLWLTPYKLHEYWRKQGRKRAAQNQNLQAPYQREATKTGRNDPCTCGSG